MAEQIVRCPYCMPGDQFRPMFFLAQVPLRHWTRLLDFFLLVLLTGFPFRLLNQNW
jgi:hypothetical protein